MVNYRVRRLAVLGLALAASSGCVSPVSKPLRAQAARDLTVAEVVANPDAFKGKTAIWGGTLIRTTNLKEGTELLVCEKPLDPFEEPRAKGTGQGRFIVRSTRFLDPVIYTEDAKVTVAGVVAGTQTVTLDNQPSTWPVIEAKEVHLWPRYKWVYVRQTHPFNIYGWQGPDGWWYYHNEWPHGIQGGWYRIPVY